jgi:hypothetical protein
MKFSAKREASLFAFSACRAWWQGGERCAKTIDVFLVLIFVARQCRGGPQGFVRARNVCARACTMFATANKQTCDFGMPKSVFLVRSLPRGKE